MCEWLGRSPVYSYFPLPTSCRPPKSLGGYNDAKSGRRLVFAVFVNNAKLEDVADIQVVNNDLGDIATAIYELN
jgi:D-alanyl-D-alanine carboxypeptidase